MNDYEIYIGVDVAKEALEVSGFDRKSRTLANTPAGINQLIARVRTLKKPALICCEASGGYEKLLAERLLEAEIAVAVVNAKRVRDFARSKGQVAKTDPIDAELLAEYAQERKPRALKPIPSWQRELQALLIRRDEVVQMIKQEKKRLDPTPLAIAAKYIRRGIRSLEAQLRQIEQEIKALRKRSPELEAQVCRITQVKGLGEISALALLAFLPEIGQISDNEAAALVGVAPFNRDSGKFRGQRYIVGGRPRLRRILYMAAVSASHTNPVLREFYTRLLQKGKPVKVALIAVLRKLVCLANQLIKDPELKLA